MASNQRDYCIHPSTIQKYSHQHKFRNLVSDGQEIHDFITWINKNFKEIANSNDTMTEKFNNNQTIIAVGFN
jgi:hypothetical protein